MINLRTNKLHLPHLRAVVPMHRTQGRHRTIDVTTGLTVTFRVPEEVSHQFGLSWHQFVTGGTVEKPIRDGNHQLVMKDETKNMCRVTESVQKQHGKISKPTSHFTSRCQTRTSHDVPNQPRLDGELGRDHGDRTRQIEGHLKATKTLDDSSQTPPAHPLWICLGSMREERFSRTGENTAKCFGIDRSGHVGCVDTASNG